MGKKFAAAAVAALAAAGVMAGASSATAAEPPPLQRLQPDHMRVAGWNYMVAVIYQHDNWGGARIEWYGGAPCTTSYDNNDYSERALDEENFDNRTSSLRDLNSCDTALFQFADFQGERSGGADGWFNAGNDSGNKYNLDTWNDRASSIKWS
jgi:hypothetical protein